MNFKLSIINDSITPQIEALTESFYGGWKTRLQAAGANRFATIVNHNFGFSGEDRPKPWPILTAGYANEFHGGNRFPTLQLSGELQDSIQIEDSNPAYAEVFTDNEYALNHQEGDESTNLPARPFFPMDDDGNATPYTEQQVLAAMENELERMIAHV